MTSLGAEKEAVRAVGVAVDKAAGEADRVAAVVVKARVGEADRVGVVEVKARVAEEATPVAAAGEEGREAAEVGAVIRVAAAAAEGLAVEVGRAAVAAEGQEVEAAKVVVEEDRAEAARDQAVGEVTPAVVGAGEVPAVVGAGVVRVGKAAAMAAVLVVEGIGSSDAGGRRVVRRHFPVTASPRSSFRSQFCPRIATTCKFRG
jgi:hypothetical protein